MLKRIDRMSHLNAGRPRFVLAAILVTYTLLAVLFAVYTPPWQAPDEPAHYNYVRYLVEKGQFPILQMGDYSQGYLDWIKEAKFPPILSIDSIRYESHQPPLYYLLAAPLFAVTGGALLPLRLFSVLLGAGLVFLAYLIGRRVFPAWPALALAVAAFVAFLPQHLATVAQVGNDALAELLLAAVLLMLVGWVGRDAGQSAERGAPDTQQRGQGARGKAENLLLGVLCGLVLITKTTAYVAVLLAGGVLIWEWWRERAALRRIAAELGLVLVPAALISFPWYLRDILTYGWPDFLGLARHDSIVIGQMRLAEYLARFGWSSYVQRLVTFTFDSFWGKFGWQGVPMDSRVYTALAIFSCAVGIGLLARIAFFVLPKRAEARPGLKVQVAAAIGPVRGGWAPGVLSAAAVPPAGSPAAAPVNTLPCGPGAATDHGRPHLTSHAPRSALRGSPGAAYALALCALCILLSVLVYAWYNLQFVQHQGRYLFTALIPLAVSVALGWEEALRPERSRVLAAGLALLAVALLAWGLVGGHGLPKWPVALALLSAAAFAIRPWLPRRVDGLLFALPYFALPLLALYGLFGAIVPQLAQRLAG
jgi:4-amino-4-deoxy-L-arabinose transferase-like glycosyltransferase